MVPHCIHSLFNQYSRVYWNCCHPLTYRPLDARFRKAMELQDEYDCIRRNKEQRTFKADAYYEEHEDDIRQSRTTHQSPMLRLPRTVSQDCLEQPQEEQRCIASQYSMVKSVLYWLFVRHGLSMRGALRPLYLGEYILVVTFHIPRDSPAHAPHPQ